jgi:hypothetical protein
MAQGCIWCYNAARPHIVRAWRKRPSKQEVRDWSAARALKASEAWKRTAPRRNRLTQRVSVSLRETREGIVYCWKRLRAFLAWFWSKIIKWTVTPFVYSWRGLVYCWQAPGRLAAWFWGRVRRFGDWSANALRSHKPKPRVSTTPSPKPESISTPARVPPPMPKPVRTAAAIPLVALKPTNPTSVPEAAPLAAVASVPTPEIVTSVVSALELGPITPAIPVPAATEPEMVSAPVRVPPPMPKPARPAARIPPPMPKPVRASAITPGAEPEHVRKPNNE